MPGTFLGRRARGDRVLGRVIATLALLLSGCNRAPSREAALAALKRSPVTNDTATIFRRVWEDGPPWFSCAEVIAKFDGHADRAAVHDQVGNWRPLVVAGWLTLRDTSAGVVSEPGWCAAQPTELARLNSRAWMPIERDTFPTGRKRRGWTVPVGRPEVSVDTRPRLIARDTASAPFVVSVAVNVNGAALGADRDSLLREALLVRADGAWRVVSVRDARKRTDTP